LSKIEFKKFLAKQFPSKYSKKKLDEEEEKEEEHVNQDNKKRCSSSSCGNKKKRCKSSDESDVSSVEKDKKKKGNFNIILQIGGGKGKKSNDDDDDYENDSYWEDISEEDEDINGIETEDEDEPVSSDSDSEDDDDDDDSSNNSSDEDDDSNEDSSNDESSEDVKKQHMDIATIEENIKEQKDLLFKFKNDFHQSSTMQKYIRSCEKQIKAFETKKAKKEKKHKEKNSRIFRKIIRDKNAMNDVDFFNKMEMDDQKKILKELREINKVSRIEKPYRLSLLETSIPVHFKAAAMKKINLLRGMDPSCGEYFKIKNWVDTFMRMPFGQYKTLHVNIEDGVERCHEFMEHAKKTLDSAVYGLNDAKMQIMQMLGQLVTNPKSIGSAIAIHGPPGTGALFFSNYFLYYS
jgi:ATP-dependent Lon protease